MTRIACWVLPAALLAALAPGAARAATVSMLDVIQGTSDGPPYPSAPPIQTDVLNSVSQNLALLTSFSGREGLSQLFNFRLEMLAADDGGVGVAGSVVTYGVFLRDGPLVLPPNSFFDIFVDLAPAGIDPPPRLLDFPTFSLNPERNDLRAVIRSILLDPEARGTGIQTFNYGILSDPIYGALRFINPFIQGTPGGSQFRFGFGVEVPPATPLDPNREIFRIILEGDVVVAPEPSSLALAVLCVPGLLALRLRRDSAR